MWFTWISSLTICLFIVTVHSDDRIVNGEVTNIEKLPFAVSVLVYQNGAGPLVCTGVIVTELFVISAGHCFVQLFNYAQVHAGSNHYMNGGQTVRVAQHMVHPRYNEENKLTFFDLSLLRLQKPLIMGPTVQKAVIHDDEHFKVPAGEEVVIAGWGQVVEHTFFTSDILLSASLITVAPERCIEFFKRFGVKMDPNEIICAGGAEDGKDSCNGDSGGPMVHRGAVVGLVSYGEGCGVPGWPAAYVKLSHCMPWVRSTINKFE